MDGIGKKQRRAENVKADEIEKLVSLVESSKEILYGKFSMSLTKEKKNQEWLKIAEKVSTVSGISRNVENVKKKITTLTSDVKKKATFICKDRRITGGGNSSATPLTLAEDRIVGLLSKADYEGIDGGFETGLPVDFLETTTSVSEVVEVDATQPPSEKKTRPLKSSPETLALLEIEREKLQLYRERVAIERERLLLEREHFEWEKKGFRDDVEFITRWKLNVTSG
ncbi:unnamed protein product [Arctogadus glacialis]